jgi:oligosaccharyltransferase complex subunit alpha (ribophorin I)
MWSLARAVALLSLSSVVSLAAATNTTAKTLLDSFTVPQAFENTNLVRNVNLERSYPRETANIVVKNVGSKPASEYYYLFPSDLISHVSGFEVRDRNDPKAGPFNVELAQYASPKYISPSETQREADLEAPTPTTS